jgi:hypothetical protein
MLCEARARASRVCFVPRACLNRHIRVCVHLVFFLSNKNFATNSIRFHIRSRLGQRHESTNLTSLFYKNLYLKVIYVYFL